MIRPHASTASRAARPDDAAPFGPAILVTSGPRRGSLGRHGCLLAQADLSSPPSPQGSRTRDNGFRCSQCVPEGGSRDSAHPRTQGGSSQPCVSCRIVNRGAGSGGSHQHDPIGEDQYVNHRRHHQGHVG